MTAENLIWLVFFLFFCSLWPAEEYLFAALNFEHVTAGWATEAYLRPFDLRKVRIKRLAIAKSDPVFTFLLLKWALVSFKSQSIFSFPVVL